MGRAHFPDSAVGGLAELSGGGNAPRVQVAVSATTQVTSDQGMVQLWGTLESLAARRSRPVSAVL